YPFDSKDEWELASFLLLSNLSMSSINEFLSLQIKKLGLSFINAKHLQARAEMLPKGPEWKCKPWMTEDPTKKEISLYYHNPVDCIRSLMSSPLLKDH
ncbi:hypothetical protein BJV78DRAFT_1104999, partial [Lactifluus subvellereus]